jgi:hypothetical protein
METDERLQVLERYLENMDVLLSALVSNDQKEIDRRMALNEILMKQYDRDQMKNGGDTSKNCLLRAQVRKIMNLNERCLTEAAKKCAAIKIELEGISERKRGIGQYRPALVQMPRFIDNKT